MESPGSDLRHHVMIPMSLWMEVCDVYFAAKRDGLVAKRPPPAVREPEVERQALSKDVDFSKMELVPGYGVPGTGFVPRGAASPSPQEGLAVPKTPEVSDGE